MAGAIDEYIQWKKKNETIGCVFARLVATKGINVGAHHVGVTAKDDPLRIARSIHNAISKGKSDLDCHAIAVVIPSLVDLEALYFTFTALGNMDGWTLLENEISHKGISYVAFQLTYELQRADGVRVPSESLVLGPFEEFPNTRRSPVTAFEIFVGIPPGQDAVSGAPTERANLAHIDVRLPHQHAFDRMAANTTELRKKSLRLGEGEDDVRAKAKVTFAIPKKTIKSIRDKTC